jgi:hypothetical protein
MNSRGDDKCSGPPWSPWWTGHSGNYHLAIGHRWQPTKQTQGNGGSWKKLDAACRGMTCCAVLASRKDTILRDQARTVLYAEPLKNRPLRTDIGPSRNARMVEGTGVWNINGSVLWRLMMASETASVVCWSEFLATDPEVKGSIPVATRFSEKKWVWNRVHSASWVLLRSYLNGKVAAPGL